MPPKRTQNNNSMVSVVKNISRTVAKGYQRSIGVDTRLHSGPVQHVSVRTQTTPVRRSQRIAQKNANANRYANLVDHPNVTVRRRARIIEDSDEDSNENTPRKRGRTSANQQHTPLSIPRIHVVDEPNIDDHVLPSPVDNMNESTTRSNVRFIKKRIVKGPGAVPDAGAAPSPPNEVHSLHLNSFESSQKEKTLVVNDENNNLNQDVIVICNKCGQPVGQNASIYQLHKFQSSLPMDESTSRNE